MGMLEYTRLSLIENTVKALQSNDPLKVMNAEKVLRVQCHHHQIPMLKFVMEQVVPVYLGISEQSVDKGVKCKYCENEFRNEVGLKAHLGRKHKDNKREWSLLH